TLNTNVASLDTKVGSIDTRVTTLEGGWNIQANGGATDAIKAGDTLNIADGTNTTVDYNAATNELKVSVVDAPTFAGKVTANGFDANSQKITNVADGTADGDAVNFAQLTSVDNKITNLQGGWTVSADGKTQAIKAGDTLSFVDGTNTSVTFDDSTNELKVNVVDAPTFAGKVTANGFDASGQKITNVADGTAATDAVNYGQLTSVDNKVSTLDGKVSNLDTRVSGVETGVSTLNTNVASLDGRVSGVEETVGSLDTRVSGVETGVSTLNTNVASLDGRVSGVEETVGSLDTRVSGVETGVSTLNTNVASLDTKVGSIDTRVTTLEGGWNIQANGGATDAIKAGDTLNIADGTNTTVDYNAATNELKVSVVDAPTFAGKVTANGFDASGQKIENVKAGTPDGDAVNFAQLTSVDNKVSTLDGKVSNLDTRVSGVETGVSTLNTQVGSLDGRVSGVEETVGSLDTRVSGVETGVSTLNTNVASLDGRVSGVEETVGSLDTRVSGVETGVSTLNTNVASLDTKVGSIDTRVTTLEGGWNIQANGGATDAIKAGDTLNIADGTNTTVTYDADSNELKVNVVDAPTFAGKVTANGFDASGQKIENVKAGTVDGDAVNFAQLTSVDSKVSIIDGRVSNIEDGIADLAGGWNIQANGGAKDAIKAGDTLNIADGTNTTVDYNAATNELKVNVVDAPTFAGKVTADGFDASSKKIENVAAGTADMDAVNFAQLTSVDNKVSTLDGKVSNLDTRVSGVETGVSTLNTNVASLDGRVSGVEETVGSLDTRVSGVETGVSTLNTNVASLDTKVGSIDTRVTTLEGGWNIQANGGTKDAIKAGDTLNIANGTNTTVTYDADSNELKVNVVDAPTFAGKVTANGFDANSNKIENVKAGTADGDAVNFAQLTEVDNKVSTLDGKVFTIDGRVSHVENTITTINSQLTRIAGDITNIDNRVSNVEGDITTLKGGWSLSANGGTPDAIKAGEVLNVKNGTNTAVTYDAATNDLQINVVDAPTFAGKVTANGFDANNNRIENVAAGTADTDAVNFAQLTAVDNKVSSIDNRVSIIEGDITSINSQLTQIAGDITNIDDRVSNVEGSITTINSQLTQIAGDITNIDKRVSIVEGDVTSLSSLVTSITNSTTNIGETVRYFKADGLQDGSDDAQVLHAGSVALGAGSVTDRINSVSVGSAGKERQITNVAAGTQDTDAVNLSQLKEVEAKIGTGGTGSDPNAVKYTDSGKGTVALEGAGGSKITNLAKGDVSAGSTDAVNGSQLYETNQAVSSLSNTVSNIDARVTNIDARVTNIEESIGDIRNELGNSIAKQDDATRTITIGGATDGTVVDMSGTQGNRTITGVAAGVADNDAVNVGQLNAINEGGTKYFKANSTLDAAQATGAEAVAIGGNANATAENSVALGANSVADRGNSVSVGSAGNERQITNVADGTADTDATNVRQMNAAIANATAGIDDRFNNVNSQINELDKSTRRGIAAAAALQMVAPYLPGRTTVNAGVANYRGQNAIGVGVSRWNDKGTVNFNAGVSTSSGGKDTIIRAGVGMVIGD
ncbi:YadA-like family protein, partial [Uliginosibacterium sp. sgz301328]|uniref:YadA-like family protein n=1 Tax=Uliginosibacterium sp. sgz301328 TaxID=3243764 RepID=UPI00359DCE3B